MTLTGFNRTDALRILIMRNELLTLQQRGLATEEAVEELLLRIKGLAGFKRKSSNNGLEKQEASEIIPEEEEIQYSRNGSKKKRLKNSENNANVSNSITVPVPDIENKKRSQCLTYEIPNKKKLKGP